MFYFNIERLPRTHSVVTFSSLWSHSDEEFLRNSTRLWLTVTAWLSKKMVGFPRKSYTTPLTARFLPCLHTKAEGWKQCSIAAVDVFHLPHTLSSISAAHDDNTEKKRQTWLCRNNGRKVQIIQYTVYFWNANSKIFQINLHYFVNLRALSALLKWKETWSSDEHSADTSAVTDQLINSVKLNLLN